MVVLFLIEDLLADLGCQLVTSAATVEQAMALLSHQVFDAAILDVNLAGERSYPVADVLAGQGVPFLFSTGYGNAVLRERDRQRLLLTKPFQPAEFSAAVAQLLGG